MTKRHYEVYVTLARPGAKKARVIYRCMSIRAAERFIAAREVRDSVGVARGDYGIDASERADAVYQMVHTVVLLRPVWTGRRGRDDV